MEIEIIKQIYLIRHCKSLGQEPEARLSSDGFKESIQFAEFLYPKQIEHIVSSTYQRAIATIEPFALKTGLQINTDVRLCERVLSLESYSDWQEKLYETFTNHQMRFPGGETSSEAMARGISAIEELLKLPYKRIAIVIHGNLLCWILRYFDARFGFETWKSLTNPDVFEISFTNAKEFLSIKRIWH